MSVWETATTPTDPGTKEYSPLSPGNVAKASHDLGGSFSIIFEKLLNEWRPCLSLHFAGSCNWPLWTRNTSKFPSSARLPSRMNEDSITARSKSNVGNVSPTQTRGVQKHINSAKGERVVLMPQAAPPAATGNFGLNFPVSPSGLPKSPGNENGVHKTG